MSDVMVTSADETQGIKVTTPFEMREAFRRMIDASGMSRRKIDEIAGLPAGYTNKLLCEPPTRNIGPQSFFPLLGALSHCLLFVPDPEGKRKIAARYDFETRDERKRRGEEHWRNAKALSIIVQKAKITGSQGGKVRATRLTPTQRSKIAAMASNARWKAQRRRMKLAQQAAECVAATHNTALQSPDVNPTTHA